MISFSSYDWGALDRDGYEHEQDDGLFVFGFPRDGSGCTGWRVGIATQNLGTEQFGDC